MRCRSSPPVTAALQFMKGQAGHTSDIEFSAVGPTVQCIEGMHKWFSLMDVSNTQQHTHKNDPDTRQFSDPNDARLDWLEETPRNNFLNEATYNALVLTKR